MKSYLIGGLESVQIEKLKAGNVVFYDFGPGEIVVEECQKDALFEVLGVLEAVEHSSQYEDLFKLNLKYKTKTERANVSPSARMQERRKYIESCSRRIEDEKRSLEHQIQSETAKLLVRQHDFLQAARSRWVEASSKRGSDPEAHFLKQLELLRQNPKVLSVRALNGAIAVYTDTLFADSEQTGYRHALGEFMIVIYLDGRNELVRWFNMSRRVDGHMPGMNAPNVYPDGRACLDEIRLTMAELMGQFEIALVADLAIQFVENVQDGAYADYLRFWPRS